jgi:hypothetical protein
VISAIALIPPIVLLTAIYVSTAEAGQYARPFNMGYHLDGTFAFLCVYFATVLRTGHDRALTLATPASAFVLMLLLLCGG